MHQKNPLNEGVFLFIGLTQIDEIRGAGRDTRKAYSYMVTEYLGPRNKEVRYLRGSFRGWRYRVLVPLHSNYAGRGIRLSHETNFVNQKQNDEERTA